MNRKILITLRLSVTLVTLAIAAVIVLYLVRHYFKHPWTRDAQVQAQVITPDDSVDAGLVIAPLIRTQVLRIQILIPAELMIRRQLKIPLILWPRIMKHSRFEGLIFPVQKLGR